MESYGYDKTDITFFILNVKELKYLPKTKNNLVTGFIKKYNKLYKFKLGLKKQAVKNKNIEIEWKENYFRAIDTKNKTILETSFNPKNNIIK